MGFFRGVYNRRAADFRKFLAVAVKSPTADFIVTNQVFDKKYASIEAERELVEEFDVF